MLNKHYVKWFFAGLCRCRDVIRRLIGHIKLSFIQCKTDGELMDLLVESPRQTTGPEKLLQHKPSSHNHQHSTAGGKNDPHYHSSHVHIVPVQWLTASWFTKENKLCCYCLAFHLNFRQIKVQYFDWNKVSKRISYHRPMQWEHHSLQDQKETVVRHDRKWLSFGIQYVWQQAGSQIGLILIDSLRAAVYTGPTDTVADSLACDP